MEERLANMAERFEELNKMLADPELMGRGEEYEALLIEHGQLQEPVGLYYEYARAKADLEECRLMMEGDISSADEAWLAEEEQSLAARMEHLKQKLMESLVSADPRDKKNVFIEIRAGAGGDEAALFAGDLLRMYSRYAERAGWSHQVVSLYETDIGGVREAIVEVRGRGAFSRLRYESGVHRVQRVPVTESGGRIHTSTATVAVMPEADEVEIEIRPEDITVETFRAGGPGGQHVNKTESAVRITHVPSGIVATCQDEKSQHKNRERAMQVLRARLADKIHAERQAEEVAARRHQIGSGDRSERIRTYNFREGRVTDHRIGLTLHRMEDIMDGDLDEFIGELTRAARAEELSEAHGA